MRALLGSHPDLAFFPLELPLWNAIFARYGRRDLGDLAIRRRIVDELGSHPNVSKAGERFDVPAILDDLSRLSGVTTATVFSVALGRYARKAGRPRWGVKHPDIELWADQIMSEFPRASLVVMVRDPRDIAASEMRRGQLHVNMALTAWEWRRSVAAARDNQAHYPGACCAVRYEDLTADPAGVLRRICAMLDLASDEATLAAMLGMRGHPGWNGHNSAFEDVGLDPSAISRRGVERFRTELPPDEQWFAERTLGDELDRWGYPRIGAQAPSGTAGRALAWRIAAGVRVAAERLGLRAPLRGLRRVFR